MTSQRKKAPALRSNPSSVQAPVNQAAQRIIALLEQGRSKTGLSPSQFFSQVLQVWEAELRQADLDDFLNVACVGVEKAMSEIADAFVELFIQAVNNYHDVLGAAFMLGGLAWKTVGDEYTPWDLVQLVVRLSLSNFNPPQPGDPPVTVYDPCCGSGAFLLGFLDYIDTYYPEVLDRRQVKLYGQELTHVGWMMCRINLHIHQIARCFRRPWTYASPAEEQAEVQKGEHVEGQVLPASSGLLQQQSLWLPADVTIDQSPRHKLLVSSHPQPPKSSKRRAGDQQAPYGLGPLFAQSPLPLPRDEQEPLP